MTVTVYIDRADTGERVYKEETGDRVDKKDMGDRIDKEGIINFQVEKTCKI